MTFEQAVERVVGAIPAGEWMTYGEVAAEAGRPGAARAVGRILGKTAADLPWWRVVGAGGHITSPAPEEQAARLRAEGWEVTGGRICGRQSPPETTVAAPSPR